jgi:hypothetical protein
MYIMHIWELIERVKQLDTKEVGEDLVRNLLEYLQQLDLNSTIRVGGSQEEFLGQFPNIVEAMGCMG